MVIYWYIIGLINKYNTIDYNTFIERFQNALQSLRIEFENSNLDIIYYISKFVKREIKDKDKQNKILQLLYNF